MQDQEIRLTVVREIKENVKLDVTPYQHGVFMAALDAWACEPTWARQIKFWRFVAFMIFVFSIILWWIR